MLKLFAKSLKAHSKESLILLANEIDADAKKKSHDDFEPKIPTDVFTQLITNFEFGTIVQQVYGAEFPLSAINEVFFFIGMSNIGTKLHEDSIKVITLLAGVFTTFPTKSIIEKLILSTGIPPKYLDFATLTFYSTLQVLSVKLTQGFRTRSIVDFTATVGVVGLSAYLTRILTKTIHKYAFFIPEYFISLGLGILFGGTIHKFSLHGIQTGMNGILDSIVRMFCFRKLNNPTQIPNDYNIDELPGSMICPICHDLINDPVELNGFFFCKSCLFEWVDQRKDVKLHPVTGKPMSVESIVPNVPMNIVTMKYRNAIIKEWNRQHQEQQQQNQ